MQAANNQSVPKFPMEFKLFSFGAARKPLVVYGRRKDKLHDCKTSSSSDTSEKVLLTYACSFIFLPTGI